MKVTTKKTTTKRRFLRFTMRWAVAGCMFLAGCMVGQSDLPTKSVSSLVRHNGDTSGITTIVMHEDFKGSFERGWVREIARRYPEAVAVMCHGNTYGGVWYFVADEEVIPVRRFIRNLQYIYGDRTIVIIACNPGNHVLDLPNVVYATENVWLMPDRELHLRHSAWPEAVGNIFEFTETNP